MEAGNVNFKLVRIINAIEPIRSTLAVLETAARAEDQDDLAGAIEMVGKQLDIVAEDVASLNNELMDGGTD
jgi:hypothetical protein